MWELKLWWMREIAVLFMAILILKPVHEISDVIWGWIRNRKAINRMARSSKVDLIIGLLLMNLLVVSSSIFVYLFLYTFKN